MSVSSMSEVRTLLHLPRVTHAGEGARLIHAVAVITVDTQAVVVVDLTHVTGETLGAVADETVNLQPAVNTTVSIREVTPAVERRESEC